MTMPLAALGRLNRHARSPQGHGVRRAIYAYKALAAMLLVADGQVSLGFVRWTGACNRCTNGRFSHYDWTDGYTVRCRDCAGSGQRTLLFLETTLPDGQIWHHPWSGPSPSGRTIAEVMLGQLSWQGGDTWLSDVGLAIEWKPAGDWQPNLPAEPLTLELLVDDLNAVEDWVEGLPPASRHECEWVRREACRHLHVQGRQHAYETTSYGYRLCLGRASGGCYACGDTEDLASYGIGRLTRLLEWSLPICRTHDKLDVPRPENPPMALITPAIQRWLDRHGRFEPDSGLAGTKASLVLVDSPEGCR